MARFRSKPTEIDAVQWFPGVEHPGVCFEERVAVIGGRGHGRKEFPQHPKPYIVTMHEQRAYLAEGDWIAAEPVPDRYYPIKPDVFAKKYEPI